MFYASPLTQSNFINRPRTMVYGSRFHIQNRNPNIQRSFPISNIRKPQISQYYPINVVCKPNMNNIGGIKLVKSFVGGNIGRASNVFQVNPVNRFGCSQIVRPNPNFCSYIFQSQPNLTNTGNLSGRYFVTNQNLGNNVQKVTTERISKEENFASKTPEKESNEFKELPQTSTPIISQNLHQDNEIKENTSEIHILRYEDGFVYEGNAIESQRNGFGVLKNSEGMIVYLGNWKNDCFEGKGELRNISIEKFSNTFDFHDFGELGDKWQQYEGEFADNAFNGKGELVLTNGERFVGQFEEGRIHGEGVFYPISGEIITGVWNDNLLQKRFG